MTSPACRTNRSVKKCRATGQKYHGSDTRDRELRGRVGGPFRRSRDDVVAEQNVLDAEAQERDAEHRAAEAGVVKPVPCAHGARL